MKDNVKHNLIMGVAFIAMALIAPVAFANNINQGGNDNIAQSQNGSNNFQNVGGIVGSGNNSPSVSSSAVAAPVTMNTNTASGGKADSFSASSSSSKASADSVNVNSTKQGQKQTNEGNALSVQQDYAAQKRNPVSTAFAAPLVAADDTCMGSTSVGGQGVGFGLSVGSTWQDGDCVRRKDARELHNMGYKGAGIALMCQNEAVAQAMEAAGTPCAGKPNLAPAAGRIASAPESVTTAPRYNVRAIDRY